MMNKKHILLVDDDLNFVELLSLRLQSRDFMVSAAYSGEEALEKAKKEKLDLILLDIMLPKMSGYEVCHRLRQDKTTHHIPIIMVTAKVAPQEKIEGLYIGADDYISKPFETEELFARVEAVLRRTQSFEEREKDKALAINEIKRIIQKRLIIPHFQPIFFLQPRRLLGVEVLSRPPEKSYFDNAEALFDTAFRLGMLFDLEMVSHQKALLKLGECAKKNLVFFNISPYLIQAPKIKDFSSFYKRYTQPEMIVLELTERTVINDFATFSGRLNFFKADGFKISIDDVGSGYASLNSIVEIKPNFIKIDMHLIRNIQIDSVRQKLVRALVTFCKQSKVISIAEGIESPDELDVLINCGVDAGQGYLLGRPNPEIREVI